MYCKKNCHIFPPFCNLTEIWPAMWWRAAAREKQQFSYLISNAAAAAAASTGSTRPTIKIRDFVCNKGVNRF